MGYNQLDLNKYQGKIVSANQMAEADEIATNEFGIDLLQMMELAGFHLASLCKKFLKPDSKVLVLAGSGHNGGGGLVAAKYLFNWGYAINISLTSNQLKSITSHQLNILKKLKINILENQPKLADYNLIIDAMIGYNIRGLLTDPLRKLISEVNTSKAKTISLDIPSGLDPDTGEPKLIAITANATLTLAAPKVGFKKTSALSYLGELYLADIGIPKEVFDKV